jgi:hypothetical protein
MADTGNRTFADVFGKLSLAALSGELAFPCNLKHA